ncbi:hypothetical protein ONZ45_g16025 [Pleurotus djamor]|nr:hypothetical protein ONZ45_g16025 [Pleurotus djamor]
MARGRGRPRLYHTPEEQRMANRAKSNRSYEKRRLVVNTRRTARYRHEKERERSKTDAVGDDARGLDPTTVAEWMAHLKVVNERFKQVKNGTVRSYVDRLCHEYLASSSNACDLFEAVLVELGSLHLGVERCHAAILQLEGFRKVTSSPAPLKRRAVDGLTNHATGPSTYLSDATRPLQSRGRQQYRPRGGLSAPELSSYVTAMVDFATLENYGDRGTPSNEMRQQVRRCRSFLSPLGQTVYQQGIDLPPTSHNDLDSSRPQTVLTQQRQLKEAAIIDLPACDSSTFSHVSTAWTVKPSNESSTSSSKPPPHFRLLRSDRAAASGGPILLLDKRRRVIAAVSPGPQGSVQRDWDAAVQRSTTAIRHARETCKFEKDDIDHRRGSFPALAFGITRGPGSHAPTGRASTTENNQSTLDALVKDPSIRRLAEFQSSLMHTHAPDLGRYYRSTLDAVIENDPRLQRNFKNSDFASLTVNFGPQTVCKKHRDVCNLAWGWCAVTALGNYDYRKGGHLVLWDFELVIEFPPGYTILIPSASVYHSNTPIAPHESRYSVTQYTGGEVFRWVKNGFQMEKDVPPSTPEEKLKRWMDGIAMLKTL